MTANPVSGRILKGLALALFLSVSAWAGNPPERPKLVVGIVVDQMRYDFLYRYWPYYGKGGIKRLIEKGFSFEQCHYPYAPTVTAPGHASIYTGSTPAFHGIADNDWYIRGMGKHTYCTADSTVKGLGTTSSKGTMSPKNLLSTTIGDELKYASRGRSKVISIALKDRGSILPGGHAADAAYWFETKTGNWISSSHYMPALPAWVQEFNKAHSVDQYVKKSWAPLLPSSLMEDGAGPDSSAFEGQLVQGAGTHMPVDIPKFFKGDYGLVYGSGHGIHATTDFVLAALEEEKLGQHLGETDMLCVSYSSTDAVGHNFGPDSWEVMDTYLRLDRDLEKLLDALDKQVGLKNILIFLSADHGVAEVPAIAVEHKLPGGGFSMKDVSAAVKARLSERFGEGNWVEGVQREQIYLNRTLLKERHYSLDEAAALGAEAIRALPFIHNAWAGWALKAAAVSDPFARRLALGCHPERSGDIFLQAKSGYIEKRGEGTTHSSAYAYDTHVPMVFFGWGVRKGESHEPSEITDIAPTVCDMLKIQMPSATVGRSRQPADWR